jgi:hypothetical protein
VAIALPGFLLRSLIPLGFMPVFGPGLHLNMMLCETYAPLPPSAAQTAPDMAMPMGMDMSMPMAGGMAHHEHRDQREHSSSCPYGSGPALAASASWAPPYYESLRSADPSAPGPQFVTSTILPRAQSPRGPPAGV